MTEQFIATPISLSAQELEELYNQKCRNLGDAFFKLQVYEKTFTKKQQTFLKTIEGLCTELNEICLENDKLTRKKRDIHDLP